ncbi:DNA (cytosine-5-)-methyltransferase [bacterium]|nr:MAG: DNA (cytosine-5-)-methyltransferase [bacterium]
MSLNFIDLFAGAGGLSEGFVRAGFNPIAHVEIETAACNTLKTRTAFHYLKSENRLDEYVQYLKGDINRSELYSKLPDQLLQTIINEPIGDENNDYIFAKIDSCLNRKNVDLIIGGPPCQAYSLVGRARSKTKMEGDPRNYLFEQYARYLERYKPKMFVFENVLGLKSAKKGYYLNQMQQRFFEVGYEIKLYILDARNFGVLQNRRRIIIVGWKKEFNFNPPNLNSVSTELKNTIKDILYDLPYLNAGGGTDKYQNYIAEKNDYLGTHKIRNGIDVLTQHIARDHRELDKRIYKIAVDKWNENKERLNYNDLPEDLKTHQNRSSFMDRFKVVAADKKFSQTVVAHIAKDGHYYIHPDRDQNRSITVREAARLQSFPDDYYFEGEREGANRTAAFKQIGNAVPPLMAKSIAFEILKVLNG